MSAVTLTRNIDLGYVARTLGQVRLVLEVTGGGTRTLTSGATQADLEAAVAAAPDLDVENANAATLRSRATQALVDNRAFLAIASPTNAQNAAQVKALTRQVNGLLRLELRQLDGTD